MTTYFIIEKYTAFNKKIASKGTLVCTVSFIEGRANRPAARRRLIILVQLSGEYDECGKYDSHTRTRTCLLLASTLIEGMILQRARSWSMRRVAPSRATPTALTLGKLWMGDVDPRVESLFHFQIFDIISEVLSLKAEYIKIWCV